MAVLFLLLSAAVTMRADIVISQVYEGARNDKYVEVSNTGESAVDLSSYKLAIWKRSKSGGDASTEGSTPSYAPLSGTLAAGATNLFKNSGSNDPSYADNVGVPNASVDFDGNDSIAIVDNTNAVVDLFGTGLNNKDQNYSRKPTAPGASTVFNPLDWDAAAYTVANSAEPSTGNYLGFYAFVSTPKPLISLNPVAIEGLANTTGSASAAQSYTVTASNLVEPLKIDVSSAGIEICKQGEVAFGASLVLTPTNGAVSQTINVRLSAKSSVGFVAATVNHVSGIASSTLPLSGETKSTIQSKAGLRSALDYTVPNASFFQLPAGELVHTLNDTSGSIATLQSQIDAARLANPSHYLAIRLKAGATYTVSNAPLTLGSNMSLSGLGTSLVADAAATSASLVRISSGSSSVSIDRLTLEGSGKSLLGIEGTAVSRVNIDRVTIRETLSGGIFLQGAGATFFDNEMTVTRCKINGVSGGAGIRFKNTTQSVVMDNECFNNATGVFMESCDYGTVINNQLKYNFSAGIRLRDAKYARVASNLCSGNPTGIACEGSLTSTAKTYNFVFRNEIRSAQTGILLGQSRDTIYGNEFPSDVTTALSFAPGAVNRVMQTGVPAQADGQEYFYPPTASNWHVDRIKNGQSRTDITTSAASLSAIQAQYDAARSQNPTGVFVLRLTAPEIVGDSPLALQSDTCVVLEGTIKLNEGVPAFLATGTTNATLGFISISGGTINGQGTTGRGGLSFTNCSKVLVEDVELMNFGLKTTRVTGSDVILFAGCTDPCIVDSIHIDGGAARGIWTKGISGSSLSGMLFLDNTISNVNMDGIDFDVATSTSAAFYNLCQNNVRYGIFIEEGAKYVQAIANTCTGNDIGINLYAYDVGPTEKNTVVANNLSANRRGLRFGARDGFLTQSNFAFNNRISSSSPLSGIDAQDDGANNYISQNQLSANAADYGSTSTAVFYNSPSTASAGVDNATLANTDFTVGYADGNLAGQEGWVTLGNSTLGPVQIDAGAAKLVAGTNYQAVFKSLSPYQFTDNSSVYIRIDTNVQSASAAGADFFLVTREIDGVTGQPSGKNYFRIYIRASGTGFQIGWNPHAESGTVTPAVPTYSDPVFEFNADHKIVIRCDAVPLRSNDDTFLFVNPANSETAPLMSRTTWTGNTDEFSASASSGTSSGVARVGGYLNLVLKQQAVASTPANILNVHRIVVANDLADIGIASAGVPLPEVAVTSFSNNSTGGATTWKTGPGWSPSAPASGIETVLAFTGALSGNLVVNNDSTGNFTLNSLTMANTGSGNMTFSGGTLFFCASSSTNPTITFASSNSILQTIGNQLHLNATLKVTQSSGSSSYNSAITGTISGTAGLTKAGGGRVDLASTENSFSGPVSVENGFLYIASIGQTGTPSSLGTNATLQLGSGPNTGTLRWGDSPNTVAETSDKTISLTGSTGGGTIDTRGANVLTLNGTIDTGTNTSGRTLILTGNGMNATSGRSLVLNGVVSGMARLRVNGSSDRTVILGNAANTFAGGISIDGNTASKTYTVAAGKIGNTGEASSLGTNSTIHLGTTSATVFNVLRYTGSGETTDKSVNLSGTLGGGMIVNRGTELLKFSSPLTATGNGSKTLCADAETADIEFAGSIPDSAGGSTALNINRSGTVTLRAANTFTGGATLKGGTLQLAHTSALSSGDVKFTTGGTGSATLKVAYSGSSAQIGNLLVQANSTIDLGSDPTASLVFGSAAGWTASATVTLANSDKGQLTILDASGLDLTQIKSTEYPDRQAAVAANGTITFPAQTSSTTTYAAWLVAASRNHSNAALLDYAFGANAPGSLDPTYLPLASVDAGNLVLVYHVRQDAQGLAVAPELSTDLSAANGGFAASTAITDTAIGSTTADGATIQIRRASVPIPPLGSKAFLRIKATQN